ENDKYFSRENFNRLKELVHIIGNIRNFVDKIAKSYQDERIENDVEIFNFELDLMMRSMDISLAEKELTISNVYLAQKYNIGKSTDILNERSVGLQFQETNFRGPIWPQLGL
ncbi:1950_t:CDS:2, partial [Funneliformis geosporum]